MDQFAEDNPNLADAPAAAPRQGPNLPRLQAVLDRFEITIAEANDLVALEDYEIVVIADDSGSMQLSAPPPGQRTLGVQSPSRWDELKETLSLIVELGNCFDKSGIDIYFLNRPKITNVMSCGDKSFVGAFQSPPKGGTPLTEALHKVARESGGEKPILLFILTDGEPSGGPARFCEELGRLVRRESTPHTIRVQIMACTGDEDAVGYLNEVDRRFKEVDVTDDFYSERQEVLQARRVSKFTRGDWCMKAMLGPVNGKFDAWDEGILGSQVSGVSCALCALQ